MKALRLGAFNDRAWRLEFHGRGAPALHRALEAWERTSSSRAWLAPEQPAKLFLGLADCLFAVGWFRPARFS